METKSNITDMAIGQNFFLLFEETFTMIWRMIDDILTSFKSIAELILELTFSYKNGEILNDPYEQVKLCKTKLNLVLEKLCAQEENLKLFGKIFENLPDILMSVFENYLKSSVEKGSSQVMEKLSLQSGGSTNLSNFTDKFQQASSQSFNQGLVGANTAVTSLGTNLIDVVKDALKPLVETLNPFKPIIDILTQQTTKIKNEILKTLGIKDPCANPKAFNNSLCENIVKLDGLDFVKLVKLYSQLIIDCEQFWSQLEIFFNLKFFDHFLVDERGNGQLGNKLEYIRNVIKKFQELGAQSYMAGTETFKVIQDLGKEIETEVKHIIPGTTDILSIKENKDKQQARRDELDKQVSSLMGAYKEMVGGGIKKNREYTYDIIIHPLTNIEYSIYSHTGKQIINTYKELFNY